MILVTGATGLVGSHLLWQLLQEESQVVAIRRDSSQSRLLDYVFRFYTNDPQPFIDRIIWRIADVLDAASITAAMENISVVYHCAALVSLGKGENSMTETNVSGTRNVTEAALAAGVSKFCFVSSIAACGTAPSHQLIDENTPFISHLHRSAYSQSKYLSEQVVWGAAIKGLNVVVVNPGVILGVSGTNKGSMQIFNQVRSGLPFFSYGGSGYVDVRDVARAMILLTKSQMSGERFILVAENCSNKEILTLMAKGFNRPSPLIGLHKNLLLIVGYCSEIAGKIFGFTPSFDRSLARSISHHSYYSNRKITDAIDFQFIPVSQTVKDVCSYLTSKKD